MKQWDSWKQQVGHVLALRAVLERRPASGEPSLTLPWKAGVMRRVLPPGPTPGYGRRTSNRPRRKEKPMSHWTTSYHHVKHEEHAPQEEQRVISPFVQRWRLALSVALLGLLAVLVASPAAHADGSIQYLGEAISVFGKNVSGQSFDPLNLVQRGGSQSASQASFSVPGVVTATSLEADTAGSDGSTRSHASVEHLSVLFNGVLIQADAVSGQAEATCSGGQVVRHASGSVTNLSINGVLQTVTGGFQTIALPGGVGTILLNDPFFLSSTEVIEVPLEVLTSDVSQQFAAGYALATVSNCPAAS